MQPIEVRFFSQFCDIRDLAQKNSVDKHYFPQEFKLFLQKKGKIYQKNHWLKSSHIWSFSGMEVCLLLV
jgi:hypothetical protein